MTAPSADVIWMDGELVPWDEARVHVLTHALNHGTGVFEGIRSYPTASGPALFRLREHVERLFRSARVLAMDLPATPEELAEGVRTVVRANGFDACYLRMLAYRGFGEMGINCDLSPVSIWIAAWEQGPSFSPSRYIEGVRATISSWRRNDPNVIAPTAKIAGAYVNSSLARAEAVRAGFDDAIMLGANGNVAEATIQNVFVVADGVVSTPPLWDGPLPGITRATVLELARDRGIVTQERSLTRADLYAADEIFLTGTGAEIAALRELDGRRLAAPGALTATLKHAYADVVRGRDARYAHWLDPVEAESRAQTLVA
ncbi:MAG TPA: branched-chain amino acid transaminase [Gaiellaceae bacterium]